MKKIIFINHLKTIPNYLTILRAFMSILLVSTFYIKFKFTYLQLCIFLFASFTDFLDGFLARILHQESKVGSVLDPIADKILIIPLFIMFSYSYKILVVPTMLIFYREILVSGLREFYGQLQLDINSHFCILSKLKTVSQMLTILLFFLMDSVPLFNVYIIYLQAVIPIFVWLSTLLTIISGYYHFKHSIEHLKSDNKF